MKQILIVNHATYGDGMTLATDTIDNVDTLTSTALVAFNIDDPTPAKSGICIQPTPFVISGNSVMFALGTATTPILSKPIDRASVSYNKYVYTAPVAKIMSFGQADAADDAVENRITFPTIAVGDVYGITLIDKTKPYENLSRVRQYEISAIAGDTQQKILERLRDMINADTLAPCTAALVNTQYGILFTGKTAGSDFTMKPMWSLIDTSFTVEGDNSLTAGGTSAIIDGVLYSGAALNAKYGNATVYDSKPLPVNNVGEGTAAQIAQIETDYSGGRGNINAVYMLPELWKVPSKVVPGTTYTTYVINWIAPTKYPGHEDTNFEQELIIAVPSGNAALITIIDDILHKL